MLGLDPRAEEVGAWARDGRTRDDPFKIHPHEFPSDTFVSLHRRLHLLADKVARDFLPYEN